jgi:hypothetical protein
VPGKPDDRSTSLPTGRPRTFRLFVRSTFQDLRAERNALHAHVFPRVRELCRRHSCRFQAIDLRWGVSEQAALPLHVAAEEAELLHWSEEQRAEGKGWYRSDANANLTETALDGRVNPTVVRRFEGGSQQ